MAAGGFDYLTGPVVWRALDEYGTAQLGDRTVARSLLLEFGTPPADGGPAIRMRFEVVGDRPQCREIHIEALPGDREIRQGDLDSLRLGDLIDRAFTLAAWPYSQDADDWREAETGLRKAVTAARRGSGARRVTPEFLGLVANVYRRNVDDRPTAAVAEAFLISHSTAAEYVRRARDRELLPKTTRGKRRA